MTRSTKTRQPYRVGDRIRILYLDPTYGTCLAHSSVQQIREAPKNGEWAITYRHPLSHTTTTIVDARGIDRHGYIEKATA